MRLINVDAMNEELFYKQLGGKNAFITVECAFKMIKAQPTAFDVDMVVEQLENNAKEHDRIMCGCSNVEERQCHSKIADTYRQAILVVQDKLN